MLTNDTRKNIMLVMEALFSVALSIAVVVCALFVSGNVFELTKGRNYSDVGVQMYSHNGRAVILGLLAYFYIIIIVPVIIWNIKRSKIFMYAYCVVNFFALMLVFLLFMMLG